MGCKNIHMRPQNLNWNRWQKKPAMLAQVKIQNTFSELCEINQELKQGDGLSPYSL